MKKSLVFSISCKGNILEKISVSNHRAQQYNSATYEIAASPILDRLGDKYFNIYTNRYSRKSKHTLHSNQICKHIIGAPITHPEAMREFYEQEYYPHSFFTFVGEQELVLLVHIVDDITRIRVGVFFTTCLAKKAEEKCSSLLGTLLYEGTCCLKAKRYG